MAEIKHTPHPRIAERVKEAPQLTNASDLGFNGRLAVFLSTKFGSMATFYFLVAWMILWIALSVSGFWIFRNDPYPFTFLLFLSNLVQLFSLPILAVGQQLLSRSSDRQAEQTYKDAEAILKLQDEVHRLIKINNAMTQDIQSILLKNKKSV